MGDEEQTGTTEQEVTPATGADEVKPLTAPVQGDVPAGAVEGETEAPKGQAGELSAGVKTAIEKAVEEERRKAVKAQGRMESKLRKQINRLRQERDSAAHAQLERAAQVAADDPDQAYRLVAAQYQQLQEQQQVAGVRDQWSGYVEEIMGDSGMDLDDEATAEEAAKATEWLVSQAVRGPEVALAAQRTFEAEMARRVAASKDEEAQTLQKEIDSIKASIPDLVQQAVAKQITGEFMPDATRPGALSKKNPIKDENDPDVLLRDAFADIAAGSG